MRNKNVNQEQENVKKYPISQLTNNWPFSSRLAIDFFKSNRTSFDFSFKQFLIYTWLRFKKGNSEESGSESDSEEFVENIDFWPNLKYENFFIKSNVIFFKEVVNKKTQNSNTLTDTKSQGKSNNIVYTLQDIPDESIMREACRLYIKRYLEEMSNLSDEPFRRRCRYHDIWSTLFYSMLFTKYSCTIKKLMVEENYVQLYKDEIVSAFYLNFSIISKNKFYLSILFGLKDKDLRKRFENVFAFLDLSHSEGEILIDNFLLKKDLSAILSSQDKKSS